MRRFEWRYAMKLKISKKEKNRKRTKSKDSRGSWSCLNNHHLETYSTPTHLVDISMHSYVDNVA